MKNKFLIIGHKEHGKSTIAELIVNRYNLKFSDSSMQAAKIFIYDELKDKYNYNSFEECFIDRRNKRSEWYDLITDYNKDDKAKLAKDILLNNDIYVGMRDKNEIKECKKQNIFDLIIGVYNPNLEHESKESFNIDVFEDSDIVIINQYPIPVMEKKIGNLFNLILNIKQK